MTGTLVSTTPAPAPQGSAKKGRKRVAHPLLVLSVLAGLEDVGALVCRHRQPAGAGSEPPGVWGWQRCARKGVPHILTTACKDGSRGRHRGQPTAASYHSPVAVRVS